MSFFARFSSCLMFALSLLLSRPSHVQAHIRINEICADNNTSLLAADGTSPDWIELYNDTTTSTNLSGWFLADSRNALTQWAFPTNTILAANSYLIVFADSATNALISGQLHANFNISKSGESLFLVQPDGVTIEDSIEIPQQMQDITYGPAPKLTPLIQEDAPLTFTIPNEAGTAPTNTAFGSLGFVETKSTFTIKYYVMKSSPGNIDTAQAWVADSNKWSTAAAYPIVTNAPVLNYHATGTLGIFDNDMTFPGHPVNTSIANFVLTAEGGIYIPEPGLWTFSVASDDGFRLKISGQGVNYTAEFPNGRGLSPTHTVFNFPVAGAYAVSVIMFQGAGGAGLEFATAKGDEDNWSTSVFTLVGATNSPVQHLGAFGSFITTNVTSIMKGVNARVDTRWDFAVNQLPETNDTVTLAVRFSDGVVAKINGQTVLSSNAPASLAWNSTATAARPISDILTWVTIPVPRTLLALGTNTLTLTGLNNAATNGDFFLQAKLTSATGILYPFYFKQPTPQKVNAAGCTAPTPDILFSAPRGYKQNAFQLELSCPSSTNTIYYTLNGKEPTHVTGIPYTSPINIASTAVVRACIFDPQTAFQTVTTVSYLFLNDILTQDANTPPGFATNNTITGNGAYTNYIRYGMDPVIVNGSDSARVRKTFTNDIPTLSIVTDLSNLFDEYTGIYLYSRNRGIGWERPISLELIDPVHGNTKEFQINAGIRIRGAYSRDPRFPKYSFRFFFRSEYGAGKLDFPLFGDEGASSFDKVDLRCSQNHSWAQEASTSETFINDVYSRDAQRDMGQPYTRSRYYHLYINGIYWGLYQTQERADAEYAASYFKDTDPSHYDAIKLSSGSLEADDGTKDSWISLWDLAINQNAATTNYGNAVTYNRLRGLNPDGTRNPAYPVYVDTTNLICRYLVMQATMDTDSPIVGGNNGPNNMVAMFNSVNSDGYKWFCHDCEWSLIHRSPYMIPNGNIAHFGTGAGTTSGVPWTAQGSFNPATLHQALMYNPDYRKTFAQLTQKYFFNDGALSTNNAVLRFKSRMTEIDDAVCAESARWGKGKGTVSRTRQDWLNACSWIITNCLVRRNDYVIDHFRARGWFSKIDAPQKFPVGSMLPHGTAVQVVATNAFYYTLNGSDPLLPDGSLSIAARACTNQAGFVAAQTFIARGSTWRYFDQGTMPTNQAVAWSELTYNDSVWPAGPAIFGFAGGAPTNPVSTLTRRYISGSSGPIVNTTYFRKKFTLSSIDQAPNLSASLLCDDGAVLYINGVEALRYNMPNDAVTYSTLATPGVSGTNQTTYVTQVLDPSLLRAGENLVAVEIHQVNGTSSDLYFDFDLKTQGAAATNANLYIANFTAIGSHAVGARSLSATNWSEFAPIAFTATSASTGTPEEAPDYSVLRISKVMYAPQTPNDAEAAAGGIPASTKDARDYYAWIELCNTGDKALDLSGVTLTNNIKAAISTFSGITLQPLGRLFVVKHFNSFRARYPSNTQTVVTWTSGNIARSGSLTDPTKRFTLKDPSGTIIQDFAYDGDTWLGGTSGAKNTGRWWNMADLYASASVWSTEANWVLSSTNEAPLIASENGGGVESPYGTDYSVIRVTRLMFAPRDPTATEQALLPTYTADDYAWLELTNTGDKPMNLAGYTMTNDVVCVFKSVDLPPGGRYLVCKKKEAFDLRYPLNSAPNDSGRERKSWDSGNLSRNGLRSIDFYAPNGEFIYALTYTNTWLSGAADNTGRWLELIDPSCSLSAMRKESSWRVNGPTVQPTKPTQLVISEIYFQPPEGRNYEQFIELLNVGKDPLDLTGVQLSASTIDFTFPSGTILAQGKTIIVAAHSDEFAARYQDESLPTYYPNIVVSGSWINGFLTTNDTLTLTAATGETILAQTYASEWAPRAAGYGSSLELRTPEKLPSTSSDRAVALNRDSSWQPSSAYRGSPGRIESTENLLRISEVLAHGVTDYSDWIELHNPTTQPCALNQFYISDSISNPLRLALSATATIAPGGFYTFNPFEGGFGISEYGETILLTEYNGSTILRFHDQVDVPATPRGEAFGDAFISTGERVLTALSVPTPGTSNALPRAPAVAISELMPNPKDDLAEYIELRNLTSTNVPLFDSTASTNTWHLSGVTYAFPTNITLLPYETILVTSTNPATFLAQYRSRTFPETVRIFGPWSGKLDNDGEKVMLLNPGTPDPGIVPYYRMDWVSYRTTEPWPNLGTGNALIKYPLYAFASDPAVWSEVKNGTPGRQEALHTVAADHVVVQSAADSTLAYAVNTAYEPWISSTSATLLSALPEGATFNTQSQTLTWTSPRTGNYTLRIALTDSQGLTATQLVRIAISSNYTETVVTTVNSATSIIIASNNAAYPVTDTSNKLAGMLGSPDTPVLRSNAPLVCNTEGLSFAGYTPGTFLRNETPAHRAGWFYRVNDNDTFSPLTATSGDQSQMISSSSTNHLQINPAGGELLLALSTNAICPSYGTRVPLSSSELVTLQSDVVLDFAQDLSMLPLTVLQSNFVKMAVVCLDETLTSTGRIYVSHGGQLGTQDATYSDAGYAPAFLRNEQTGDRIPFFVSNTTRYRVSMQFRTLRKGATPLPYPVTICRLLVDNQPCYFEKGFAFSDASTEDDLGDNDGGEWLLATCFFGAWDNPWLIAHAADQASINALSARSGATQAMQLTHIALQSSPYSTEQNGVWNIALPDSDKGMLCYQDDLGWWTYTGEFPLNTVASGVFKVVMTNTDYSVTVYTNASPAENPFTLEAFTATSSTTAVRQVTYAYQQGPSIDQITDADVRTTLLSALGNNLTTFNSWLKGRSGLISGNSITSATLARVLNAFLCNIAVDAWEDDLLRFVSTPEVTFQNTEVTFSVWVKLGAIEHSTNRLLVNGTDLFLVGDSLGNLSAAGYDHVAISETSNGLARVTLTLPASTTTFLRIRIQP